MGFPGKSTETCLPIQGRRWIYWVQSLSQEDPGGAWRVTHSSALAWDSYGQRSLWTAVYGVAQSQDVHWSDLACLHLDMGDNFCLFPGDWRETRNKVAEIDILKREDESVILEHLYLRTERWAWHARIVPLWTKALSLLFFPWKSKPQEFR